MVSLPNSTRPRILGVAVVCIALISGYFIEQESDASLQRIRDETRIRAINAAMNTIDCAVWQADFSAPRDLESAKTAQTSADNPSSRCRSGNPNAWNWTEHVYYEPAGHDRYLLCSPLERPLKQSQIGPIYQTVPSDMIRGTSVCGPFLYEVVSESNTDRPQQCMLIKAVTPIITQHIQRIEVESVPEPAFEADDLEEVRPFPSLDGYTGGCGWYGF